MLTISKALSAGQAQSYHTKEFTAKEQSYWAQGNAVQGEWQGRLAEQYGLAGPVRAEEFARLSQGQHPQTEEQLVRLRTAHEYENAAGKAIKTMEHRAGWDATFSAPKSVSLTALVGGDDRVREAHRKAFGCSEAVGTVHPGAHRRQPSGRDNANSSSPSSSTTQRGLSMAMPRRSSIPMP